MRLTHIGHVKEASSVIGYFAYTKAREVICDGDACIIAGSEDLMKSYLKEIPYADERDIIKKTRFGEIIQGLKQGGAYAFDKEAYTKFLHKAKMNKIEGLPEQEAFFLTRNQ